MIVDIKEKMEIDMPTIEYERCNEFKNVKSLKDYVTDISTHLGNNFISLLKGMLILNYKIPPHQLSIDIKDDYSVSFCDVETSVVFLTKIEVVKLINYGFEIQDNQWVFRT